MPDGGVSDAAGRDADIAELLRQGAREAAFAALVERYGTKIYRLCVALLRDHASAEDAAQESLLRTWKSLASFDGRAALSTWIYAIARNRCLTAIERRRDHDSLSDPGVEQAVESMLAGESRDAGGDDADRDQLLRDCVDEMPERYRRALVLYYYEERSVSDVAAMLGVPEGTVKTTLFRARALLKQRLRALDLDDATLWLEGAP